MEPIRLTLPEPPSANRYWRHVVVKGQGRTLLSSAARTYRLAVQLLASRCKPIPGKVTVVIRWDRKRRSGDLDNRLKQVLDALQGIAYTDDQAIVELHAYRTDRGSGTVQVEVCEWISIWDESLGGEIKASVTPHRERRVG
jgi:Holliday junction resolvase RusA-like endonuclease